MMNSQLPFPFPWRQMIQLTEEREESTSSPSLSSPAFSSHFFFSLLTFTLSSQWSMFFYSFTPSSGSSSLISRFSSFHFITLSSTRRKVHQCTVYWPQVLNEREREKKALYLFVFLSSWFDFISCVRATNCVKSSSDTSSFLSHRSRVRKRQKNIREYCSSRHVSSVN